MTVMSKPTAVCLAPILLILDYWPLRRTEKLATLLTEKIPLLAMTTVVMFLTVYGQMTSLSMSYLTDVTFLVRCENALISYVRYLGKIIWPIDLACFYPYDKLLLCSQWLCRLYS